MLMFTQRKPAPRTRSNRRRPFGGAFSRKVRKSWQQIFWMAVIAAVLLSISAMTNLRSSTLRISEKEDKPLNARIIFAIDNAGELYINGLFTARITHWRQVKRVATHLKDGDTVSVIARDTDKWFGVIVDIEYTPLGTDKKVRVRTGQPGWKAVKQFKHTRREDKNAWMKPDYATCQWPEARSVHPKGKVVNGMAPKFPYRTSNAKYVWAANAGKTHTIFLRFQIGGEICSDDAESIIQWQKAQEGDEGAVVQGGTAEPRKAGGQPKSPKNKQTGNPSKKSKADDSNASNTPESDASTKDDDGASETDTTDSNEASPTPSTSPSPTPSPATDGTEQMISGQDDATSGGECPCRIAEGPPSDCWEYEESMPRCRMRPCGDKYECVTSNTENLPICMRRMATERVVPESLGSEFCRTEQMPPQEYYVLYMVPEEEPTA